MNKEYVERIKETNGWIFHKEYKANLICTDDIDSLLSCLLLMQFRPSMRIGYYYDFREGLYVRDDLDESLPMVGIDLSNPSMKCISNHVTKILNDDAENPNEINMNYILKNISIENYHSKYNLNTLILLYSLLGLKPKTDAEKAILLLPDSSFMAAYAPDHYKDKYIQKKYLCEVLDLPELWEFEQGKDIDYFTNLQDILNTKSKLWVTDIGIEPFNDVDIGLICKYLNINYDPEMLQGLFYLQEKHESYTGSVYGNYDKDNYFSFAVTSKSKVKYSMKQG